MADVLDEMNHLSDEEFMITSAKNLLNSGDHYSAKAWMITAKTLYPNNFSVQFAAYNIEKAIRNVKEAAKYFSELVNKFQPQPELWKEIENITSALRSETGTTNADIHFLCNMFKHIPLDIQHQLLLVTADHCEDTMEHCRVLLLLLRKFPSAVINYGPKLVDTLLSAEKHSHASNQPVNSYRRLLVCELLPLLEDPNLELSFKLLFRLLNKSLEFYLSYILFSHSGIQDSESKIDQPWSRLYEILGLIGRHLGWEAYLMTFNNDWSRESYWQKLLSFCQTHKTLSMDDHVYTKQLLYSLAIFFLNCLHEYYVSLAPEAPPGQTQVKLLLVEAFTDPLQPHPLAEPKTKRRKSECDMSSPYITVDKPGSHHIINNFMMAVNCWDLLKSSEVLEREFNKLMGHLKLDTWLSGFTIDYAVYKGKYDDAIACIMNTDSTQALALNVKLACMHFRKKNYSSCLERILLVVSALPANESGVISSKLVIGGTQRHLHYLPLTQLPIVQFCTRMLTSALKENIMKPVASNEFVIGNLLVLIQFDWPQQEDIVPLLMEQIRQRKAFHYPLFQNYIINIDILEELMYLSSDHGGNVMFDIVSTNQAALGQRRIGTRGADKGVKEDFKQAMKKQVARCGESLYPLTILFLKQERMNLLQTLCNM